MLIDFEGIKLDVTVKRIKTMRLYVNRSGQAKLSIPVGVEQKKILDFLNKNKLWLINTLENAQKRINEEDKRTMHEMREGESFQYLGKTYTLRYKRDDSIKEDMVKIEGEQLLIIYSDTIDSTKARKLINDWYFYEFKTLIMHYIEKWLPIMKEKPLSAVHITKWKSRWGTMNPSLRIAKFNIQLIFYPKEAIESVVVHELCHLKESSHNTYFHCLMANYLPDYKTRERALERQ